LALWSVLSGLSRRASIRTAWLAVSTSSRPRLAICWGVNESSSAALMFFGSVAGPSGRAQEKVIVVLIGSKVYGLLI